MAHRVSTRAGGARLIAKFMLVCVFVAGFGVLPATAKSGRGPGKKSKPAVTKMRFKLADHKVTVGETVTGTVTVLTGKGNRRTPFAGAELAIKVDGVKVSTTTAGEDGTALVEVESVPGDHAVKVVFDGDETHKKAQRAQGYEGVAAVEEEPTDGSDNGTDDGVVDEEAGAAG